MTHLGQACSRYAAHVAHSENCDVHILWSCDRFLYRESRFVIDPRAVAHFASAHGSHLVIATMKIKGHSRSFCREVSFNVFLKNFEHLARTLRFFARITSFSAHNAPD